MKVIGGIGCCDSSKNKHASAHAADHGHHTARSGEAGETWVWCYTHDRGVDDRR